MAKVSILMGIYNCSTTLSEAIESILNQTKLIIFTPNKAPKNALKE